MIHVYSAGDELRKRDVTRRRIILQIGNKKLHLTLREGVVLGAKMALVINQMLLEDRQPSLFRKISRRSK